MFQHGGLFKLVEGLLCYDRKKSFGIQDIDPDKLSRIELIGMLDEKQVDNVKELWYCKNGMKMSDGLVEINGDKDILELCQNVGSNNSVDVFVVREGENSPNNLQMDQSTPQNTSKSSKSSTPKRIKQKAQKPPTIPRRRSTRKLTKPTLPQAILKPPTLSPTLSAVVPFVPPQIPQIEEVVEPQFQDHQSSSSDTEA